VLLEERPGLAKSTLETDQTLSCPKCGYAIKLSESLAPPLVIRDLAGDCESLQFHLDCRSQESPGACQATAGSGPETLLCIYIDGTGVMLFVMNTHLGLSFEGGAIAGQT
jgi:hypothetical protein